PPALYEDVWCRGEHKLKLNSRLKRNRKHRKPGLRISRELLVPAWKGRATRSSNCWHSDGNNLSSLCLTRNSIFLSVLLPFRPGSPRPGSGPVTKPSTCRLLGADPRFPT